MTPYAYRISHAAVEPLVMALLGTNRDTGFDIKKLAVINDIFEKEVMPKYKHLLDDSKVSLIDINVLHDTPGERYKMITGQVKDLCFGLYGKTAVPINAELQAKALKV